MHLLLNSNPNSVASQNATFYGEDMINIATKSDCSFSTIIRLSVLFLNICIEEKCISHKCFQNKFSRISR